MRAGLQSALALALALFAAAAPVHAAPARAPRPRAPAAAAPRAPLPAPSLEDLGPVLEGTWELESMTLPDGTVLAAPVASGVIVVDKGAYLAAAYLQPTPKRKVGSIFEGRLEITGASFRLVPATGYRYDSAAEFQVQKELPPVAKGVLRRDLAGLVFEKEGGGIVTFPAGKNQRVQQDPDGTTIVHRRTSLVPQIPKDLPGRRE